MLPKGISSIEGKDLANVFLVIPKKMFTHRDHEVEQGGPVFPKNSLYIRKCYFKCQLNVVIH